MSKYVFNYFVGGFYDTYQSFTKVIDDDEDLNLIIVCDCPLGRSPRAFVNLECRSFPNKKYDEKRLINYRLDYCYKIN